MEKNATYRVFLVFSNSPTLHQVKFYPDGLERAFSPNEARIPQADSYEEFTVGEYDRQGFQEFCAFASSRGLNEVATALDEDIGDRTKLVTAYEDAKEQIATEDFSLRPWRNSKKFLPVMMDAFTRLRDKEKAALKAFGEEREDILHYLDTRKQCEDELSRMHDAIALAREAKSNYCSPKADREKALATWKHHHETAMTVVKRAKEFARSASDRIEQEESSLGISTVSKSSMDNWTQYLSNVAFDVAQQVKTLIQEVKTLAH